MFSVVKVREGLARNDYKDPGWFKHPQGTVAFESNGVAPDAKRVAEGRDASVSVRARKPTGHGRH